MILMSTLHIITDNIFYYKCSAILIIINLFKTNVLEDEHLLFPDKIYLCQKIDGPGFT